MLVVFLKRYILLLLLIDCLIQAELFINRLMFINNCVILHASRLCGIHPLMQSISMIMKTMDLREQKHISAGSKLDTFFGFSSGLFGFCG